MALAPTLDLVLTEFEGHGRGNKRVNCLVLLLLLFLIYKVVWTGNIEIRLPQSKV